MSTPAQRLQADRLNFPGLLPREVLVLKAWLRLHEGEYTRFDYNVRLGQGTDPGPTWPDDLRKMAILNSQKRVDAVGFQSDQPTLIEVKDRAGFSAVGQIVGYNTLWRVQFPTSPAPKLLIVCNRYAPDILPVLQANGIALNVVDVDFAILRRS